MIHFLLGPIFRGQLVSGRVCLLSDMAILGYKILRGGMNFEVLGLDLEY